MTRNLALFLVMCLMWGITWIAVKGAINVVPPVFFAAARYILVTAIMIASVKKPWAGFRGGLAGRTLVTGVLMNVGTYSLLFMGMVYLGSGVASLVNLSLMPLFLYGFALAMGEERLSGRHVLGLVLGMAGLAILFSKGFSLTTGGEAFGALLIALATASYALGSVLAKPLLKPLTPFQLSAAHAAIGAVGLTILTLSFEPVSMQQVRNLIVQPPALAGLLYMVIGGTLVGYGIYLILVRDWGAARAGLYSFVSPVIALILGALVFGESVGWREVVGGVLMLGAAALTIRPASRVQAPVDPPPA